MVPLLANMDAKDFDLIIAVSAKQRNATNISEPNRTEIETEPDRAPLQKKKQLQQ